MYFLITSGEDGARVHAFEDLEKEQIFEYLEFDEEGNHEVWQPDSRSLGDLEDSDPNLWGEGAYLLIKGEQVHLRSVSRKYEIP